MSKSGHTPPRFNLYRRGEVWWIDARTPKGRLRATTGCTDREAAAQKALAMLDRPRPATREPTLENLLDDIWRSRWSKSKSAVQLRYVVPAVQRDIGHLPLREVSYDALRQYGEDLQAAGKSAATANRRISVVSSALREAWRRGLLKSLPAMPRYREAAPRDRYLTHDEEQAVLTFIDGKIANGDSLPRAEWEYVRDLFVVLIDTGCRLSEALTANAGNIAGDSLRLTHGSTKSGRGRSIPLTPRASEALGRLIEHPVHGTVSDDWCGHRWGKVRKACSIAEVNLHVLCHTCASRLVQGGVDLYTVSAWLGHSSVKVTERYAHLRPDAVKVAMQALLVKQ